MNDDDPMLCVREDGVQASWSVVDSVLRNATPVREYDPNTWGPIEADCMTAGDGGWHDPKPIADKAMEATK